MILPTKRLTEDRALLAVGADILKILDEPKTVSRVWADLSRSRRKNELLGPLTFDWFVLALDLLFTIKAIIHEQGFITKAKI